ncbi:MAG: peptide ABC transporter substrate-binding protein [Chloroflexota bacterium]
MNDLEQPPEPRDETGIDLPPGLEQEPPPTRERADEDERGRRRWLSAGTLGPLLLVVLMVVAGLFAAITVTPGPDEEALARPSGSDVVLAGGAPVSWDPAAISDATSAQMLSQVYEGLTALDADSRLQPALAESWTVSQEGRRITFNLRPDITFSDGTAISAEDVRRSWLRVIDPRQPSPLSSLLDDVAGAAAYARGEGSEEDVGISADGQTLSVEFERPASYFPAVTAVPTLAVVPASIEDQRGGPEEGRVFTASGAYVPVSQGSGELRLSANDAYWAGPPSIESVVVITDDGGRSSVDIFEDEAVDWTSISAADASWIRYDRRLGPQLRRSEEMVVDLMGFDTTRPPFDDPRARRAVAMAVDWRRLGRLARLDGEPATSLVPPGIAARGSEDYVLPHDPDAARAELAAAGYPGGAGFPAVALATYGIGETSAIAADLERELGIDVAVERRPFEQHAALLEADIPALWTLSWSADYPHAHDFLGLLLRSGSSANAGGWSNAAYDELIDRAAATADLAEQERLYGEAQQIIRDDVPLIPLSYGGTWSLSRDGLRGANVSGTGTLRYADLAWKR